MWNRPSIFIRISFSSKVQIAQVPSFFLPIRNPVSPLIFDFSLSEIFLKSNYPSLFSSVSKFLFHFSTRNTQSSFYFYHAFSIRALTILRHSLPSSIQLFPLQKSLQRKSRVQTIFTPRREPRNLFPNLALLSFLSFNCSQRIALWRTLHLPSFVPDGNNRLLVSWILHVSSVPFFG